MVKEITTEGFEELESCLKKLEKQTVFVLFTGTPDANGASWCPDCVIAEPVIHKSLTFLPLDATFIHARVGERTFWKDHNNPFRTKMGITCIPTLVKWGKMKRLEDPQCADLELLKMLYESDD